MWFEQNDDIGAIDKFSVTYFLFADDETLVAKSCEELQSMINDVAQALDKVGLTLSVKKIEWMPTSLMDFVRIVMVNNVEVQQKHHTTLLGTKITADLDTDTEVTQRNTESLGLFLGTEKLLRKQTCQDLDSHSIMAQNSCS